VAAHLVVRPCLGEHRCQQRAHPAEEVDARRREAMAGWISLIRSRSPRGALFTLWLASSLPVSVTLITAQ